VDRAQGVNPAINVILRPITGSLGRVNRTQPRTSVLPDAPQLDMWLPDPVVRVAHRRDSTAPPERLWHAAQQVRLRDTSLLGRLVRWRIPGVPAASSFEELFRNPPFAVLSEADGALVAGLVGRIWTLRRDYPQLEAPEEFREWSESGTAKVLFAHWVEPAAPGRTVLRSETRLTAFGVQGRVGLTSVRPLIGGFQHLVGSDALAAAVRRAESS